MTKLVGFNFTFAAKDEGREHKKHNKADNSSNYNETQRSVKRNN